MIATNEMIATDKDAVGARQLYETLHEPRNEMKAQKESTVSAALEQLGVRITAIEGLAQSFEQRLDRVCSVAVPVDAAEKTPAPSSCDLEREIHTADSRMEFVAGQLKDILDRLEL